MRATAEPVLRRRSDRGAILVVAGITLTALLTVVALVVDLGLVRTVRRSNQSVTDLAALSAGEALGTDPYPDGRAGCASALNYLEANLQVASLTVPCTSLPAICGSSTTPVTVTGTTGDHVINITYPVSDAEIADDDVADPSNLRVHDGYPCERLKVSLTRTFGSVFAGIIGRDSFTVEASSVVRQVQSEDRRVPSLWLLDPVGCPALDVQGGSQVIVGNATVPGLLTVDSDGSACAGNSFTIDVGGAGSSVTAIPPTLVPPAEISLVAMDRLQTDCATGNLNACDPADIAGGLLDPQPIRRSYRATRAPVDHMFNCKSPYPDYHGIPIDSCTGTSAPYIDQLRTAVGAAGTPLGFNRWTDFYGCNNPVVPVGGVDGNWHIDCGTFRISSNVVVFNGGNMIVDGEIVLTGGSLTFNDANPTANLAPGCLTIVTGCLQESASTASWVVMRSGNLRLTGGGLVANHTMIYQDDGYFSIAGGSPPIWTAPTEGPFKALSVWSEKSSNKFTITGGASMELEGTFFTPEAAPMKISGGAPVVPLQAQFVSYRLVVSGGASITLSPNPNLRS